MQCLKSLFSLLLLCASLWATDKEEKVIPPYDSGIWMTDEKEEYIAIYDKKVRQQKHSLSFGPSIYNGKEEDNTFGSHSIDGGMNLQYRYEKIDNKIDYSRTMFTLSYFRGAGNPSSIRGLNYLQAEYSINVVKIAQENLIMNAQLGFTYNSTNTSHGTASGLGIKYLMDYHFDHDYHQSASFGFHWNARLLEIGLLEYRHYFEKWTGSLVLKTVAYERISAPGRDSIDSVLPVTIKWEHNF